MRLLLVGDPHAVPSELEDCQRLVDLIDEHSGEFDRVVFLGDQHHTHGVVHLSVVSFWREAFARLGGRDVVIFLVGNHDKELRHAATPGCSVAEVYRDVATVVTPSLVVGGVGFVSHYPKPEDFVREARKLWDLGARTLVCHQTFIGALGESGFVLPDGVDPADVPQIAIFSGHLHTPQHFDKVWYPGAPRWRTLSDAPVLDRSVWLVQFDELGNKVSRDAISTAGVCRAVRSVEDSEGSQIDPSTLTPGTDWRVTVVGTPTYVAARKAAFTGCAKVNVRYVRESTPKVRESDGPVRSLHKFLETFESPRGTPRARLCVMIGTSP